ncbi:hypothetical protein K438DRAFT_652645 [Mycena galopus ATCC 62051]|nr:hypothetical protein K438DRAFT_652645 [Mycena galopus ATCC 62051]
MRTERRSRGALHRRGSTEERGGPMLPTVLDFEGAVVPMSSDTRQRSPSMHAPSLPPSSPAVGVGVRSRCGPVAKHEIRALQLHVPASQCETTTLLVLGRCRRECEGAGARRFSKCGVGRRRDKVMLRPRERLCRSLRLGRYFPLPTQSRALRHLWSLRAQRAGTTRCMCRRESILTSPSCMPLPSHHQKWIHPWTRTSPDVADTHEPREPH